MTRQPASYAVAQGSRPAAGPEDPTAGKSAGHGAKGSRGRRPAHDTDLPAPTWRGGVSQPPFWNKGGVENQAMVRPEAETPKQREKRGDHESTMFTYIFSFPG